MNHAAFGVITERRFPKLTSAMRAACQDVIFNGVSAYKAELVHGVPKGTVSRQVRAIQSEFDYCQEVAGCETNE